MAKYLFFVLIVVASIRCLGAPEWSSTAFVSYPKSAELASHLENSNSAIPRFKSFFKTVSLPESSSIYFSPKTMASAYRTLWNKSKKMWDVEELNDTLRTKIVVDSLDEAYLALESIKNHSLIQVNRIKDKYTGDTEEGYYAIHLRAEISGFPGQVVEIQIVDRLTDHVNQWSRLFFTDDLFDRFLEYREQVGEAGAQFRLTGQFPKIQPPQNMPDYLLFSRKYFDKSLKNANEGEEFYAEREKVFFEELEAIKLIKRVLDDPLRNSVQSIEDLISKNRRRILHLQQQIDEIKIEMANGVISQFKRLIHSREIREELIFINRLLVHSISLVGANSRVGFYWGTFDPLHKGHIQTVLKGKEAIPYLQATYIIPNMDTHHKPEAASFKRRLSRLRQFSSELARLGVLIPSDADFEYYRKILSGENQGEGSSKLKLHHKSRFMNYLGKKYGDRTLKVQIIGIDSFNKLKFPTPEESQQSESAFVVMPRSGESGFAIDSHYSDHVFKISDFETHGSSTQFREALARGDFDMVRSLQVTRSYLSSFAESHETVSCQAFFVQ